MRRLFAAYGLWLAGVLTAALALYLYSRRLFVQLGDLDEAPIANGRAPLSPRRAPPPPPTPPDRAPEAAEEPLEP